jgi:hypothetical protein
VRLLCLRGRCTEAGQVLDQFNNGIRTQVLRAEVLRRSGDLEALASLLRGMLKDTLDRVQACLEQLAPGSRAGWADLDDRDRLPKLLSLLRPQADCTVLELAEHVPGPDLTVDVDFAPDLAWLSEAAGQLATLTVQVDELEQSQLRLVAETLNYPDRLVRHQQREECWFWMQEAPEAEA